MNRMMSSLQPYKYCHVILIFGLFSCFSTCRNMSSSSPRRSRSTHRSSSRRRSKKHHHRSRHRRGSMDDFASTTTNLLESLKDKVSTNLGTIHSDILAVCNRVTALESAARTQPRHEQSSTDAGHSSGQSPPMHRELASENQGNAQSRVDAPPWSERPPDELPDYEETVYWAPEESEEEGEIKQISDTTAKVLRDSFSTTMNNDKRRSVKRKQPVPDSVFTKCPKLDPPIMSKLPKTAKEADRSLARLQTLVLDAANPLVSVLESARKGLLTPKDAAEAAQQALQLLGNASANISVERRKKATRHLNQELLTIAEEEATFTDAAPMLFGKEFDKRAKEHLDTAKLLQPRSQPSQSIRRGHPPTSRGGGSFRGKQQKKKN